MDRPVMSPTFLDEHAAAARPARQRFRWVGRIFRVIWKVLFGNLFAGSNQVKIEEGSRVARFIRGALYRLMFVPLFIVIFVSALVWIATHPARVTTSLETLPEGLYYDTVAFSTSDGVELEAWFIPMVDAHKVILEREAALHKKYPAVVLVHDYGRSGQQMFPLVEPLHYAGFVVLSISTRGSGCSSYGANTFGLNESRDVEAAVSFLRSKSSVDPDAISIIGVGTGATAAVLAAQRDGRIKTVVLDKPVDDFNQIVQQRIAPAQAYLRWIDPLYKWAFEIGYRGSSDDLNLKRIVNQMDQRRVLVLADDLSTAKHAQIRTPQVVDYLRDRVGTSNMSAIAATPKD